MRIPWALLPACLALHATSQAVEVHPPSALHCVYAYGRKLEAPFVVERIGDTIFLNRLPVRPVRTPRSGALDLARVTPDYDWHVEHCRRCEEAHRRARERAATQADPDEYVAVYAAALQAEPYVRQVRRVGERTLVLDYDCDRPCCRNGRLVFTDPLPPVDSTAMLEAQVDEIAALLEQGAGLAFGFSRHPYEILIPALRAPRVVAAIRDLLDGETPGAGQMDALPLSHAGFVEDLLAAGRKRE